MGQEGQNVTKILIFSIEQLLGQWTLYIKVVDVHIDRRLLKESFSDKEL